MNDPNHLSDDYISVDNVKDGFMAVGRVIFLVIDGAWSLIRRYWMIFVILVATGTGIGFLLKRVVTFNSELTMLVKFNDLNRSIYTELLGSLSDLAETRSSERLASVLQIKSDDAQQISEVTLEKSGRQDPNDDSSRRTPFLITVSLRSITAADPVEAALVRYINKNPYIKNLKDSELVYYRGQLDFLNSEIRKLDSLKTAYNLSINSGRNATIYYNAFNPADIYMRSGLIMEQKQKVMEWFASEQNAMSVISSVKTEKISRKKGVSQIVLGFVAGFVLAFLIAIWQDLKSKVADQGEKSKPA